MVSHKKTVVGSAVTSTARAQTGTIAIPGGQGGTLIAIEAVVYGTLETVVNSGGLVELENDAVDWKPFEFYTNGFTAVDAGGADIKPFRLMCRKNLPSNSTVTVYYTPQDNQSQKLAITLHWETTGFSGMQTYAKSGVGAALTATTASLANITISIPAEKGGNAKAILAQVFPTDETVVNSGGLLAFHCSGAHWEPLEFYTGGVTCITEGGGQLEVLVVPFNQTVPSNSSVTVDVTPQDNQSQIYTAVVVWEGR